MNQLTQTASFIASEISSIENKERKRTTSAQKHFKHVIECLVRDLWLGTVIHPEYEAGMHGRSNWYSETPQYRDRNLTYPQPISAYDGMTSLDLIRVSKDAYFNPDTGRVDLTKVIATESYCKSWEAWRTNHLKLSLT